MRVLVFLEYLLYNVRMKVVVDANIYLAVILNEPEKQRIIEVTQNVDLISPIILPFEIGNALSALLKRKSLNKSDVLQTYEIFKQIPLRLVDVNIETSIKIAADFDIYAYDAYYLESAKRYNSQLLTLDKKMKNVAISLGINVMEV